MLARQRGLIIKTAFFSFNSTRFRIHAPTVQVVRFLQLLVVAVGFIAFGQIGAQKYLSADFLLDFLEACSAVGGDGFAGHEPGGWVHAKLLVVAERDGLFSFEVAIASAIQAEDAAGSLEVHSAAWTAFGFVLATESGTCAGAGVLFLELLAGETVHAPTATGGTVVLGGHEETVFIADRGKTSNETWSVQSQSTFFVAWGTHGFTVSRCNPASGQFFASFRIGTPAISGGWVALFGFVVTSFSALWNIFAGHFCTNTLFFLSTWSEAFRGGGHHKFKRVSTLGFTMSRSNSAS